MKKLTKTNREILTAKGDYGTYHKPLAQQIGLEAAVLLDFLVYKYDYFIDKKDEYMIINKHKAFYITHNDIEEATCIKASKLNRKSKSNPIQILVAKGLIRKKTVQVSHLKTSYYTLFFDKIEEAFDRALVEQNNRRKEKKKVRDEKLKSLLESDNKVIDDFLENTQNEHKTSLKPNENLILQNDSMETVETSSLMVQNKHITKNKITNNNKNMKKLTSENKLDEDSEFTDKELEDMFDNDTIRATSINSKIFDNEVRPDIEWNDLYNLIKETRRGIKTSQVFFNEIVNEFLNDKFKGFTMSTMDEILIHNTLIDNPLFELENEDITERDDAIVELKKRYLNISEEQILEEIEYDDDKHESLYNMVWEKIMKNCERINEDKLEARFGNIFVGVREISENYRPFLDL